ncbi:MAG: hydrolase [Candidatus Melainabacteria bacterium GWF2_37_15]|nr:MAG: hydrolase [Candidatus Melainabacteria bacterium GWF2_37_15]
MVNINEGIYDLLSPENSAVIFIDHEPQMIFGVGSIDRQLLLNNIEALAKSAKMFNVPTVLTTVAAKTFSGEILDEIKNVFPDITPIDRTTMNSWEDENFVRAVKTTGRKKLIIAALWTEVCLAFPVLYALKEGYEVYIVVDASAGVSKQVHKTAIKRMIQAGARPVTWMQVLLEFQRDWSRKETYNQTLEILEAHGGAYGTGIRYVKEFYKNK